MQNKIINRLASFLYPHRCSFCRSFIDYNNDRFICSSCMTNIPFIKGIRCLKCGAPVGEYAMPVCHSCRKYKPVFTKAFIPLIYKDTVRRALLSLKFFDKVSYCKSFAYLIANEILDNDFPHFDFITYVPVSDETMKTRGYNQAQLIAEQCAEIFNLPVVDTLSRKKGTVRQSSLSLPERRKNAKISFESNDIKLCGTALLIDDIYTTGSTANAVSSLLLKMGCDKVYVAALAMTVKK